MTEIDAYFLTLPLHLRHRLEDLTEARRTLLAHCEREEKRFRVTTSASELFRRLLTFLCDVASGDYRNDDARRAIVAEINGRIASLEIEYQALFEQAVILSRLSQQVVHDNSLTLVPPTRSAYVSDYGPEWAAIAEECKRRDAYRCVECQRGRPQVILHAHHEFERSRGGEDSLSNLTTLCDECHAARHRHMGIA